MAAAAAGEAEWRAALVAENRALRREVHELRSTVIQLRHALAQATPSTPGAPSPLELTPAPSDSIDGGEGRAPPPPPLELTPLQPRPAPAAEGREASPRPSSPVRAAAGALPLMGPVMQPPVPLAGLGNRPPPVQVGAGDDDVDSQSGSSDGSCTQSPVSMGASPPSPLSPAGNVKCFGVDAMVTGRRIRPSVIVFALRELIPVEMAVLIWDMSEPVLPVWRIHGFSIGCMMDAGSSSAGLRSICNIARPDTVALLQHLGSLLGQKPGAAGKGVLAVDFCDEIRVGLTAEVVKIASLESSHPGGGPPYNASLQPVATAVVTKVTKTYPESKFPAVAFKILPPRRPAPVPPEGAAAGPPLRFLRGPAERPDGGDDNADDDVDLIEAEGGGGGADFLPPFHHPVMMAFLAGQGFAMHPPGGAAAAPADDHVDDDDEEEAAA
eukprot:TRINITY_DN5489_c0_g1_i1.p1 TRINITY_DN5489_c0_g1~~TRINITY_DN5489_c0_g1_i1.p1  ORF type:complete len:469 (+),score=138.07 TRINITY_DN5489_c0_g1_i1:93-1409(+)